MSRTTFRLNRQRRFSGCSWEDYEKAEAKAGQTLKGAASTADHEAECSKNSPLG